MDEENSFPTGEEVQVNTEPAPEATPPAEEETAQRRKKQRVRRKRRSILAAAVTLLLIVLALLVFLFREELTGDNLRRLLGGEAAASEERDAFTYETGANQVFAPAGNGLAVVSASAAQLLNERGETVQKQVLSFETPAVFACGQGALFCDLGGTDCLLMRFDRAEPLRLSEPTGILCAGMNENGWFFVASDAAGYKGRLAVYDASGEKRYEWWSGSGYLLKAAVSPDNRSLAVLCAEKHGSVLHLLSLDSEEERAKAEFPGELVYDLSFRGSDLLCLVGEQEIRFLNTHGEQKGSYPLGEKNLLDYDFGSQSFVTLFLSDYRGGAGGTLVTLDGKGEVLGTAELERDVVSLCGCGRQVLVMTAGDLSLYNQSLNRQNRQEALMTARRAILRPEGDVLLLNAYAAERFSF